MRRKETCKKCGGTGQYQYDENHITVCDACCTHLDGWYKLEERYGNDNGKYACKRGCGTLAANPPDDEESLMQLTKNALADVLGREPTKQEVLRAHAGFKRMAFVMHDHLKREEKENIRPRFPSSG